MASTKGTQLNLRVYDEDLLDALRTGAERSGLSLNAYVLGLLAKATDTELDEPNEQLERAVARVLDKILPLHIEAFQSKQRTAIS